MSHSTRSKNFSNAALNKTLLQKYLNLPQPKHLIQMEYIWIDGTGETLRSKTKTVHFMPKHPSDLPSYIYESSSMFQTEFLQTDSGKEGIRLCPVAIYSDPFRRGDNKLVLCDTYYTNNTPTETNKRYRANQAMESVKDEEIYFIIDQEYTLLDLDSKPLGWPKINGSPDSWEIFPMEIHYCGVGADKVIGREIVEAHYRACLYAGVQLTGTKAKAVFSRWEFQVGQCTGISAGDDLWIARFILHRIAEEYGVLVTLDPKPIDSLDNVYAYISFSTKAMRGKDGAAEVEKAIDKLSLQELRHIQAYNPRGGKDSKHRPNDNFSFHKIEFIKDVKKQISSFFVQDRRPKSNSDPYSVCDALVRTCVLNE